MKIMIENLAKTVTSDELSKTLENEEGFVLSRITLNKKGTPSGRGYVEFETHQNGKNFIQKFSGKKISNKRVKLSQVRSIPISVNQ